MSPPPCNLHQARQWRGEPALSRNCQSAALLTGQYFNFFSACQVAAVTTLDGSRETRRGRLCSSAQEQKAEPDNKAFWQESQLRSWWWAIKASQHTSSLACGRQARCWSNKSITKRAGYQKRITPGELARLQRFVALLLAADQVVLFDLAQQSGVQCFLAVLRLEIWRRRAELFGPRPHRHRVERVQEPAVRLRACSM